MIDLRCCSADDLLLTLDEGSVDAVIADPPWSFASGKSGGSLSSAAGDLYSTLNMGEIAATLADCFAVARRAAYLAVWSLWPLLDEWAPHGGAMSWRYVSGAVWGKTGGAPDMSYHFRGDSEPLLLYRKGNPRPLEGSKSNLWLHPRLDHSEKPPNALEALVRMSCPEGGTVLDPYAGESASLAKVCRRLGRNYIGAELKGDDGLVFVALDLKRTTSRRACLPPPWRR